MSRYCDFDDHDNHTNRRPPMTTPDPIKAALERLITMASDELTTPGLWAHSRARWDADLAAARAALAAAQPEGEGPTDQELDDFIARVWPHSPGEMPDDEWRHDMAETIRAAVDEIGLSRWGRPAHPARLAGGGGGGMSNSKSTITEDQKRMLRLIERSPDTGGGWRPVSNPLWMLVLKLSPPDLTELDHVNHRVRFTPEGIIVMKYLP